MRTLPLWVFVVVAAVTTVAAFGLAQVAHGAGMIFVLAATAGWMVFVQVWSKRMDRVDG